MKDNKLKSTDMQNANNISEDNIYHFMDLYFKQKNIMYSHLYNSFDKLLDEDIPQFLKKNENMFYESVTKDKIYRYRFQFDNIGIKPPYIDIEDEIMFPQDARMKQLTYLSKLVANVTQYQDVVDIATGDIVSNIVGETEKDFPITNIPIMVRTKYCSLNIKREQSHSECEYDPGGYFIVKGSEKVVIPLEEIIRNYPFVSIKKESSNLIHKVRVYSKCYRKDMLQIIDFTLKKDMYLTVKVPRVGDVSVFMLMKVLGIETDKDIVNYCVYDKNDTDMLNLMKLLIENSRIIKVKKGKKQDNKYILSKEEIIDHFISKIKITKKYTETDLELKKIQKKIHLNQILENNLFPHIHGNLIEKAHYIGYVVNRLLQCILGRIPPDDRDSFLNKRVELPGSLMFDLFKQYFKKMMNDCRTFFSKRNTSDQTPLKIIHQIKPNIIEQGLIQALSTGNWSNKKGVAQVLERTSYLKAISSLRKLKTVTTDASTNKLAAPRHLHPSHVGSLCYIETPEGHNCGLQKSLSLIGNVTVMKLANMEVIESIIKPKLYSIMDVPSHDIGRYTRVFLNGEIIGLTDTPRELYDELKSHKYNGVFDKNVGVFHDIRNEIECYDLKINCDSGRLFHPVARVENNKILLTQEMIDMISVNEKDSKTRITNWNDFLARYPGVIEYIDTDEKANSQIGMLFTDIRNARNKMVKSVNELKNLKKDDFENIVNRYDDFMYLKYTHCEIHPSFLVGNVVANVPFLECNQGPRNIYQFSQAKQAIGIYTTNYRDRLDISYILYHPQRPIVTNRLAKYINTDKLPFGENCMVAIACYTGYNQEDSLIINRSALDRGLCSATSLKKGIATISKNQATTKDDMFIKPNPSQVTGRKFGTYDKLNEKGYAPEETVLEKGDIYIGQVSPIQKNDSNDSGILYKDNSKYYDAGVPGVVDKVYTGIYTSDGYEMRKVRLRSQRIPKIGDKFCCYDDTHEVLTKDGWINISEINYNHKVATLVESTTLKYVNPIDLQKYQYNGKMYNVKSDEVELCVTPNHRMYVGKDNNYFIETAENIYHQKVQYKRNISTLNHDDCGLSNLLTDGTDIIDYIIHDKNGKCKYSFGIEYWITLFSMWYTSLTHVRDNYLVFYAKNQNDFETYITICQMLDIPYKKGQNKICTNYNDNVVIIYDTDIVNDVKKYCESLSGKRFPSWVWELSMEQSNTLLLNIFHKNLSLITISPFLKDDVQRLALHAGHSVKYYHNQKFNTWKLVLNSGLSDEVYVNDKKSSFHDELIDFNNYVYCCTVPGDGIIYVRKNGKPVWCGQSRHAQKGICGLTLSASDMPFTEKGISPDFIINPNAFPKRMTMGHLLECLVGKVAALEGQEIDSSPYSNFNIKDIKKRLEDLGYKDDGTEYLYNGMTGEKIKSMISIGPTYYQRLKHIVADKMHCLTMDHDVLTEGGWKSFTELKETDKVATLRDGKLRYERPRKLLYYPDFEGELYHIKTQQVDLKVTTNHRMYVSFCRTRGKVCSDYEMHYAEDIYGKHVKYKKDADWDCHDYQFKLESLVDGNNITREEKVLNMDEWLKFFGFWIAEGWTSSCKDKRWKNTMTNKVQICQVKKHTREMIISVIKNLGYNPTVTDDKISISDKQLFEYLQPLSKGAPFKSLPDWVWKLSKQQCRLLIEYMILGDGSVNDKDNNVNCYYYTSSIALADDFMRLCLHAGWSANKTLHHAKENQTVIKGRTVTSNYDLWRLGVVKTKNRPSVNHSHVKKQKIQIEETLNDKCPVFCLEMPTEIFYVRRNGIPVWTCNSRSRGPQTILTRQPPEGRARDGGLRFGEMERDCMIAHGLAKFLKERLLETADMYHCFVCNICGLFAQRYLRKDSYRKPTKNDLYYCRACRNHSDISKVRIPYAFKLLIQELLSMNIAPRIRTKK